jgi:hypothetical protein
MFHALAKYNLIENLFQSYDFILSPDGQVVPEDVNPSASKLQPVSNGYVLHNVSGIRTHIVSRLDGKGYDVTKRTRSLLYIRVAMMTN